MTMKQMALALLTGVLLAGQASADGLDGPRCRNCPWGDYSVLHYWFPGWYEARAFLRSQYLDQYPPGPFPAVPPSYHYSKYLCPPTPPMPSSPYADPEGYFGRPLVPR